jgi:preprotein translocase subunit SecF
MWWDKPKPPGAPAPPPGKPFAFMKIRALGFIVTFVLLAATIGALMTRGLNFGLDFTGGVLVEAAHSGQPFDAETVRKQIAAAGIEDAAITLTDNGRTAVVRLPPLNEGQELDQLANGVKSALGEGIVILKTDAVGPKVSGELLTYGVGAAVLAVIGIAIYVWFRFESRFGWAALLTTFHDVLVIVGLFAITGMTFDLTSIAAILTIAGYSINDTVVVFDRIREMLKKYKKLSFTQIIDESITATLSRTIMTSFTTLITSLVMMFLGGPVLFGFAAAISFGIIVGTYSSIFVAAPLLIYLPGKLPGQRATGESGADPTRAAPGASGA